MVRKFPEVWIVKYSLQALQFHLNFAPESNLNDTSDIVSDTVRSSIGTEKKFKVILRQNKVISAGWGGQWKPFHRRIKLGGRR